MWSSFFLACFAGAVMLYLPGMLVLKAFRFSNTVSVLAAPIPSCLFYAVVAVLCGAAGVALSGALLLVVALSVGAALLVVSVIVWKAYAKQPVRSYFISQPADGAVLEPRFKVKMILLYAVLGLALGIYVYVKPLDGPECFPLSFDDLTHLGLVQSFIETGNFSTLTTTVYPDYAGASTGYYPALWHQLAAMVATALGVSNLLAANVVNYLISSLVYPLGMLLLFLQVFRKDKRVIVAGSLVCLMLLAFPWGFLIIGRLLANLMGFVFIPLILACVFAAIAPQRGRVERIRLCVLALLGCSLALFAQPNMVFSVLVMSIPYMIYRIWNSLARPFDKGSRLKQWGSVGIFLVLVIVFWVYCLQAPFMQSVVTYSWNASSTIAQALVDIFFVCSSLTPIAPILAFFMFVGIGATIKERRYLWVTATFVLLAVMYVACAATNGIWDIILTGFWYTDKFRISAMLGMVQTLLIALGLARTYAFIVDRKRLNNAARLGITACLMIVLMFPSFLVRGVVLVDTPFGHLRHSIQYLYRAYSVDDDSILSAEERGFLDEAKAITGDARVYNAPYDGSMFAYQYNGMRTYQRQLPRSFTEDEALLNHHLNEYGTNETVREAADALGIEYVLMLDHGHDPFCELWPEYHPENWEGFEAVEDGMPGLELVLSEGDMRLYRLVPETSVS